MGGVTEQRISWTAVGYVDAWLQSLVTETGLHDFVLILTNLFAFNAVGIQQVP